jgi:hypothetical protein
MVTHANSLSPGYTFNNVSHNNFPTAEVNAGGHVTGMSVNINRSNNQTGAAVSANLFAAQGFYVYLRSLDATGSEFLAIVQNSVRINWGDQSWGFSDLPRTALQDNYGNTVYRLHLYDVILGGFTENQEMFPNLSINFDIRILPQATQMSLNMRDLVFWTTIDEDINVFHNSTGTYANNMHMRMGIDPMGTGTGVNYFIPGCSRASHGNWVGTTNTGIEALVIMGESRLIAFTDLRILDSPWTQYSWEAEEDILQLVPNEVVRHRLNYDNQKGDQLNDFTVIFPIPKVGESIPSQLANDDQNATFGFTLSLAEEVINAGYTVLYSDIHTAQDQGFLPWSYFEDNPETIRSVRMQRIAPLAMYDSGYVYITLVTDSVEDMVDYTGEFNKYATRIFYTQAGTRHNTVSFPAAMRSWQMVYYTTGTISEGLVTSMPNDTWAAPYTDFNVQNVTPQTDGYRFVGWASTYVGDQQPNSQFVMPGYDIVLVAQWVEVENGNDDDTESDTDTDTDTEIDLDSDIPSTDNDTNNSTPPSEGGNNANEGIDTPDNNTPEDSNTPSTNNSPETNSPNPSINGGSSGSDVGADTNLNYTNYVVEAVTNIPNANSIVIDNTNPINTPSTTPTESNLPQEAHEADTDADYIAIAPIAIMPQTGLRNTRVMLLSTLAIVTTIAGFTLVVIMREKRKA